MNLKLIYKTLEHKTKKKKKTQTTQGMSHTSLLQAYGNRTLVSPLFS